MCGIGADRSAAPLADELDQAGGPGRDREVSIDGGRQAEPAGVVGVLADDVDSPGGDRQALGRDPEGVDEEGGSALLQGFARA